MKTTYVYTPTEWVHEFDGCTFRTDAMAGQLYVVGRDGHDVAVYQPGGWSSARVGVREEDKAGQSVLEEIAAFMDAGGQDVPGAPHESPSYIGLVNYMNRCLEELEETQRAYLDDDRADVVDGFLDLAYVAFTGALRVAGVEATQECWDAIMRANTSKIDGSLGPVVRDEITGKILKPEGWEAPDIEGILEKHSDA